VKWRSIKVNVRFSPINSLRYLTFSSVRAVFDWPLPGFRFVADPRSSTRLQILLSLSKASNHFPEILQQSFGIQNKTKFPQCLDPSFIFVRYLPLTKAIGLTAIVTWNIEEFIAYYNTMLHVNVKIMTSRQRRYLSLSYFNNKINFLSLEVCVSVNLRYFKLA